MKKQLLLPALLLSAPCWAQQPASAQDKHTKTVVIRGQFTGDTKGYNKVYVYGTNVKSDSAVMTNGLFTFTMPFEKPFTPAFYTEYDTRVNRMYSPYVVLVDQPGTVTLSKGDISKGMHSMVLSGLPSAVSFENFRKQQQDVRQSVTTTLTEKYGKDFYQDSNPQAAAAKKEMDELLKAKMASLLQDFVSKNPDSYAAAWVLSGAGRSLDIATLESIHSRLSDRMKATDEARNVVDYINGVKNSTIGSAVADFTLNTPDEKPVVFSQLKGKYVLIDFWASWCGPCKQSFPHMKEVYKKYKSDQFEIYSISIDKDKNAWLKGVEEQQLPWLSTLDTKNVSQRGFAITAVPTTYLVGPDGKILMKEVGFEPDGSSPIEKKLEELFGKK
ncbi:MAG: TlpA disulfide reductase family protein [Candidatus Pseudobacter hemicellulosilyticus]|uniref:TlpA disulfide reductase family protein n=1 Tax=Candidatus Pseudobacter hemicellulosilyticus TaxID=3121375 RepID=A0AAJ5WP69_9BACT|nr:MAG: TlpA disulfide reductase family protein [Pseudobacter sp.]